MSKIRVVKEGSAWSVTVDDGPNLSRAIIDGGVVIECREFPLPPLVHITFTPSDLEVDLPDAVIVAMRKVEAESVQEADSDAEVAP